MKKIMIIAATSMILSAWGSIAVSSDMMMDKKMDSKDVMQNDAMKKDSMSTMEEDNMKKDKMGMNASMEMDASKKKEMKKEMKKDKMMATDSM